MKKWSLKRKYIVVTAGILVGVCSMQIYNYCKISDVVRSRAQREGSLSITYVEEAINEQFSNMRQAGTNLSYDKNIHAYLAAAERDFELHKYINTLVSSVMAYDNNMQAVAMVNDGGEVVFSSNVADFNQYQALEWVAGFQGERNSSATEYNCLSVEDNFYLYLCIPVYGAVDEEVSSVRHLGEIVFLTDGRWISSIFEMLTDSSGNYLALTDLGGKILMCSREELVGSYLSREKESRVYQMKIQYIPTFQIVSVTSAEAIAADLRVIRLSSFFTCAVTLVLLLAMLSLLSRHITKPIVALQEELEVVGEKNLKQRVKVKGKSLEADAIAQKINTMLDRIEAMTKSIFVTQEQLYESEIRRNQLIVASLQSRINPHFLYNTLDCIRGIAMANDIRPIEDVALAMSDMFRYSIKGGIYVRLRDELEIAREYLKIIDVRFGGKFEAKIQVEEEILDARLIKMTLQPLIENAVLHGLEKKRRGTLWVRGVRCEKGVKLEIMDNGMGIQEEKLQKIKKQIENVDGLSHRMPDGIGLGYVCSLLRQFYGEAARLTIESEWEKGTKVTLELPYEPFEEEKENE